MIVDNMSTIPEGNVPSDTGNQEPDIMSVFDVPAEGQQPLGDQGIESSLTINTDDTSAAQASLTAEEIDPRFANLPKAEALLRTYQSRYDKLYSEHQKIAAEIEEYRQYKQLIDQLLTDDEVLEAFVYKRKPDLVKERDITEIIKAKMREEFGDYKPTREEAEEDPGGKAWLYYKRLDELYNEYRNKSSKAQSFEEILKRKAEEEARREKIVQEEINKVKQAMRWTDEQLIAFRDWAAKLTPLDLAKIYNYAVRTFRVPQASGISGSTSPSSTPREEFLRSLKTR
ncbi:MAG: hypothetical protein HPY57_13205 [Ignavibacteria bacterium]|nr:hypothetical protein [Ignavibacteria bacterium]